MQPNEQPTEIFIVVIDETYDRDEGNWEEESERYRLALEDEFSSKFIEANVGPAADIPAFLTILATANIPLWTMLLGAFFLGKPINENLESWAEIGNKIRSFFGRPVILARHGAAVLAVEAVIEEIGGLPETIRLVSYRPEHISDEDELTQIPRSRVNSENPPTLNLGFVGHIFEIEADGIQYRVRVHGKECETLRL